MVPVAHGIDVGSLPGAVAFGTTPASTPETVSFIMDARNLNQLEWIVDHGVTHDLSVPQFAAQYGQSPSVIAGLQGYLAHFGITTTQYPDGLDVSASGTAGEFDAALAVHQEQFHVPGRPAHDGTAASPAQTVHGAVGSPELPAGIAQNVLAILGLTNYAPFVTDLSHAPVATQAKAPTTAGALGTAACEALSGLPSGCNLPTDFAARYGLQPLSHDGATGAGETIGIVTLAALDPDAPHWFWSHIEGLPASQRTVTVQNIDGGPGAPSDAAGTGETDLDVEQSGGVAPGANVIVYQAPNTDPGFADAFFTAASQNIADTVSASWGESETVVAAAVASGQETPAYEAAFDEAFLELAAQGQSTFLSAGDSGAYDASGDLGSTNLSVDASGDSPYVTSAGGTTLPWSGTFTLPSGTGTGSVTVSQERAWGWDYLWPAFATINGVPLAQAAEQDVVGGGGGFSTIEATPSYQQGVRGVGTYQGVKWLTPIDAQLLGGIVVPTAWDFNEHPVLVHGTGSGRQEPDLSTDADPFTGYLLYEPSWAGVGQPTIQGGWGGTSFVAPQLNGSAALIDSWLGHRVGLWNPSIYAFAQGAHSPFTPLQQVGTSNDNIFFTGQPGALYNQATGLGTPNLTRLAQDFASQG